MRDKTSIDNIRKQASAVVSVTAIVVAALFWKLVTTADFADPLHVMVLIGTATLFATAAFGLVALGAYCQFWILRALESRDPRR